LLGDSFHLIVKTGKDRFFLESSKL
jgi:hypothetical protein